MALQDRLDTLRAAGRNALELIQRGRLSAPYRAPFRTVYEDRRFRLRHYSPRVADDGAQAPKGSLLLVPPLMVAADVYDISPELSAVAFLARHGIDTWLVDFGAPEIEEGGLERTLDDHILAVDKAITEVRERTGEDVHVAGYSQGGMFVYQCAAYRRSEGVASVITFGSPVDVRKALPVKMHDTLADRFLTVARDAIQGPLQDLRGLPGMLTSGGFRVLGARKEIQQVFTLFGLLHDREALEKREPRRRFIRGEGFVAWPGPALRDFIDQVVVENRMTSGGFVVDGRSVSLADITCPVLYFVGLKDDIARPPGIRAIRKAAPNAELHERTLRAGHFGLVVGSKALGVTWPQVIDWVRNDAKVDDPEPEDERALEPDREDDDANMQVFYDLATDVIDGLWERLGDVGLEFASIVDAMRWQLPRLAQIRQLRDDARVSVGRMLAEQAVAIPDETFFLWKGRAFTYAQANARVNQFAHALLEVGIAPGEHVGILMDNHPDYLTAVAALSRIGAVAVLLNAGMRGASLAQALEAGEVGRLIADGAHADVADEVLDDPARLLVLQSSESGNDPPAGSIDLDGCLSPDATEPPEDVPIDAHTARDTALLMFTSGTTGMPKAARITNRRWALAALGAAASCTLTNRDTVYCCLPLHHATGMLLAVGGALAGGARLALAPKFSRETFWTDVRRYGATVVFYVGELCRYLVAAEPVPQERRHAIRLFAGGGLRAEVWTALVDRLGGRVRILEFYASTEGNVGIANVTGEKVGSIGREIPGIAEIALVEYDVASGEFVRDEDGMLVRVDVDEPGVLISRVDDTHPLSRFDGYVDEDATNAKIIRDAFLVGDAWFNTGDLLRKDGDGDYWFVDRLGDTFRWKGENVSTQQVIEVVEQAPGVRLATAYGVRLGNHEGRAGMAAIELDEGAELDTGALYTLVRDNLFPSARPRFVRVVDTLETTQSLKVIRHRLQDEGADPDAVDDPLYLIDEDAGDYVPLDPSTFAAMGEV